MSDTTSIRRLGVLAFLAVSPVLLATSVIAPTFPELVNGSDCVVRAVVKSVESRTQASPHGTKIYTFVTLDVTQVIAGQPPSPLVLRVLGGKVGNEEMVLEGAPQFHVGDDDILFVQGNGTQVFPLVAIGHGLYPVVRDTASGRESVFRSNHVPLRSLADVAVPIVDHEEGRPSAPPTSAPGLTPDEFVREIRAAVKTDRLRPREP